MRAIRIVDSHTGGEPTRVVIDGGPDLADGDRSPLPTLAERLDRFRRQFDQFRSAVVNEPRGSDVMVGALLCEPVDPESACGVIFFNNVGYLGMCGHGLIGVMATLSRLGRIGPGEHRVETPVGTVTALLESNGVVHFDNVPSYRKAKGVEVALAGGQIVRGDVAWGGNWFFLTDAAGIPLNFNHVEELTGHAWSIREAVNAQGFPEVDHVELFGPASGLNPAPLKAARNFVLCPGKAYDRSPCGTGTSAKLACLAADGRLAPGEEWLQQSILGSEFRGRFRWTDEARDAIIPTISGRAFVTGQAELILDENDPFCWGIR